MNIGNYSTLTSNIVKLKLADFEVEQFNARKILGSNSEKILVLENNSDVVSDYDFAVKAMFDAGYRIVISTGFPDVFSSKALNTGLFPIEVSLDFLNKIFSDFTIKSKTKLFVDIVGQEVMIVKTGEKEYFKLSEYNKECLLNGYNDVDYIYCVYDDIHCSEKSDFENEHIEFVME